MDLTEDNERIEVKEKKYGGEGGWRWNTKEMEIADLRLERFSSLHLKPMYVYKVLAAFLKKGRKDEVGVRNIVMDNCAICRNHIMEVCIECQASGMAEDCNVAWGVCSAKSVKDVCKSPATYEQKRHRYRDRTRNCWLSMTMFLSLKDPEVVTCHGSFFTHVLSQSL
uniref:Zinc finger RING-H2-type domain-containing protein n=1 Tax=Timema shepardi TaxID=629360 RepID=A0A7R9AKY7_TIMSH|nr:unnamed protein product [Timema shepardi]